MADWALSVAWSNAAASVNEWMPSGIQPLRRQKPE
jgi:hypothetical protein